MAGDLGVSWWGSSAWGGEDSNLRPAVMSPKTYRALTFRNS
jgi:hypothetical protein